MKHIILIIALALALLSSCAYFNDIKTSVKRASYERHVKDSIFALKVDKIMIKGELTGDYTHDFKSLVPILNAEIKKIVDLKYPTDTLKCNFDIPLPVLP